MPRRMQVIDGRQVYLVRKAKAAIEGHGLLDEVHVHLQHGRQLADGGVLIDRHKDLVEQGLKVVTHHAVHDEALQWGHAHAIYSGNRHIDVHQPFSAEFKNIFY